MSATVKKVLVVILVLAMVGLYIILPAMTAGL